MVTAWPSSGPCSGDRRPAWSIQSRGFLDILIDQVPTLPLCVVSHAVRVFSLRGDSDLPHTLQLAPCVHVEAMVARTGGGLPAGDAPPCYPHRWRLFFVENSRTVLESNMVRETEGHYALSALRRHSRSPRF